MSDLLGLWSERKRSRSEVKAAALANIAELEDRAADLADMIETTRRLVRTREQRGRQRAMPPSPAKRAGRP